MIPAAYAGATLVFALVLGASYFFLAFAGGIKAALLLFALTLPCRLAGWRILRLIGIEDGGQARHPFLEMALGLGVLSLGLFALAASGFFARAPVLVFLVLIGYWGRGGLRPLLSFARARVPVYLKDPAALALLLLPAAIVFWAALAPPHQYDSLVYHMELPALYAKAGRFVRPDYLLYAQFPQNAELLFGLGILFGSNVLSQLFSCLALVLSLALVWREGGRLGGRTAAVWACFLLGTHTAVLLLSSISYVEPLAMLWTTAAVLSFLRHDEGEGTPWLVLAAIFTGLALGSKYYAGITAAILGLLLLVRPILGGTGRGGARLFLLYAGITTLVFSPWLVKNAVEIGDPFFPFLYRVFPSVQTGWQGRAAESYFRVLTEYGHADVLKDFLSLPFLLVSDSSKFGRGMDVLGNLGWDLTLWLFPLAALASARDRRLRVLCVFLGGYLAAWFSTGVVFRFLVAAAPLFALASGLGAARFWEEIGRGKSASRVVFAAAAAVLAATHLLLFGFVRQVFGDASVMLGARSGRDFLMRRLGYYPCAAFAREHLGANDKILLMGEQRSYYVDQPHEATTLFAPNRYRVLANAANSPAQLAGRLWEAGFSAVLEVPGEEKRLGQDIKPALTARGRRNMEGLKSRIMRPLFKTPACVLWSLGTPER